MSQEDKLTDISDTVQQLQLLSIQQAELVTRLDILTQEGKQAKKKPTVALKPTATIKQSLPKKVLALGDKVRVDNPRYLQATTGEVIKITQNRVTVKAANAGIIIRAAKNLTLE